MTDITQRDIESLRTTLDRLDKTIERFQEQTATTYARKDVMEPRLAAVEKDVEQIQGWSTWAVRIVLGAIIVALLGLVLAQGGGLP